MDCDRGPCRLVCSASGRTPSSRGRSYPPAGRAVSGPGSAPPRLAPCRARAGRGRAPRPSCESQFRRGKPLSFPLQTCTKRTPRGQAFLREVEALLLRIDLLRPRRRAALEPVELFDVLRLLRKIERLGGGELHLRRQ